MLVRDWVRVRSLGDLSVGDTVRSHNGYEFFESDVSEFDLEMRSVSNGLHNERASLVGMNFNYPTRVLRLTEI
jgi:hypothetical protein